MKLLLSLAVAVTLMHCSAYAQTAPTTIQQEKPSSVPTSTEAANQATLKAAQELIKVDKLLSKTLDWTELGSSTADIAAHTRKALGQDAPVIEVRGEDTNRSTFVLKQAPLGLTLASVAALANSKFWVFPGRLLLAPEVLLSSEERTWVREGMGGEWKRSWTDERLQWNAFQQLSNATLAVVGEELKERLAAKGQTAPNPPAPVPVANETDRVTMISSNSGPSPYELPATELSPVTVGLLQDLLNERSRMFAVYGNPQPQTAVIDSSTIVGFDDTQPVMVQLCLQKSYATIPTERQELGRWFARKSAPVSEEKTSSTPEDATAQEGAATPPA